MNEDFDNWEEVLDEDLFEDGELTNEKAMIKAWDNIFYGEYKLIRKIPKVKLEFRKEEIYLSECCNSVPFNDILNGFDGVELGNCLECGEPAKFEYWKVSPLGKPRNKLKKRKE